MKVIFTQQEQESQGRKEGDSKQKLGKCIHSFYSLLSFSSFFIFSFSSSFFVSLSLHSFCLAFFHSFSSSFQSLPVSSLPFLFSLSLSLLSLSHSLEIVVTVNLFSMPRFLFQRSKLMIEVRVREQMES